MIKTISIILILHAFGCAGTRSSSSSSHAGVTNTTANEQARLERSCQISSDCGQAEGSDEFHCAAFVYSGRRLALEDVVFAIGNSECQATNFLRIEACERGLNPDGLGDVKCQPKNSASCPGEASQCEKDEVEPSFCKTKTGVTVYASSECIARYKLQSIRCSMNLPPLDNSDMTCEPDE